MWVCLCKAVTDGEIRAAIAAGARTASEIAARCRAGTRCGGCLPEVCRLLSDYLAAEAGLTPVPGEMSEGRSDMLLRLPA